MKEKQEGIAVSDDPLNAIPLSGRQSWITPAIIFGGLEFCIPVIMVGSTLIGSFGVGKVLLILLISFLGIQWAGNALNGYIGSVTGRASSVIARSSFGGTQARFIVALVIFVACLGWWALQTAVAGNAICAMLGIDYAAKDNFVLWAVVTILTGLIFAIPSIIGYASMKWTDYLAVPAGLVICGLGIYLAFTKFGWATIASFAPKKPSMTMTMAIATVVGLNVSQWVIAADYTRYAKPKLRDNLLIPLGIIVIGIPLILVGAIMAIGVGTADIVQVMENLGFPLWGFLLLWLSTWTSQLVNNYTMGLSLANLLNISTNKGRMLLTLGGTLIALALSISGILNYFLDFLYFTSLCYGPIAGVIFTDFFLRRRKWEDHKGWNFMASLAFVCGVFVGYYTTYLKPMGLPVLQSLLVASLVYIAGMKTKAKLAPDHFTQNIR